MRIGAIMLTFTKLELEDIHKLRPYFDQCHSRISDRAPGAVVMWREYFDARYAIEGGALYFMVKHYGGETAFTAPFGENDETAYRRIADYCAAEGVRLVLCMVPENKLADVLAIFPDAEVESNEIWSDYLYDAQSMATFAGRKLSGQRNHCNKFVKLYPDWSFEPIGGENLPEVRSFVERYIAGNTKDSPTLIEGDRKILEVLDNYGLYAMLGGVLKVGGEIVGVSIAEALGDTLFIHIEKCLRSYEGSYQMMVREFARRYVTEEIRFINREEDDGDPGLRTSKLSYHPVELLKKYTVRI